MRIWVLHCHICLSHKRRELTGQSQTGGNTRQSGRPGDRVQDPRPQALAPVQILRFQGAQSPTLLTSALLAVQGREMGLEGLWPEQPRGECLVVCFATPTRGESQPDGCVGDSPPFCFDGVAALKHPSLLLQWVMEGQQTSTCPNTLFYAELAQLFSHKRSQCDCPREVHTD